MQKALPMGAPFFLPTSIGAGFIQALEQVRSEIASIDAVHD
jgi:hypothetical protein